MKVSIITAVFNGGKTLQSCVESVLSQCHKNIEHIIIDGGSTDETLDVIQRYRDRISYWVSEPDEGPYYAMNKGIKRASGEIVGILNSDDIYADNNSLESIVNCLSQTNADACYGDLIYVDRNDMNRVVRKWKSGRFLKERFKEGWMPPHPTFYVKRDVYEKYGCFNTELPIAADYELMLRFLYKYNISTAYIPRVLVKMRTGGRSKPGLCNTTMAIMENYRAWKLNSLAITPMTFFSKPLSKIFQFIELYK